MAHNITGAPLELNEKSLKFIRDVCDQSACLIPSLGVYKYKSEKLQDLALCNSISVKGTNGACNAIIKA